MSYQSDVQEQPNVLHALVDVYKQHHAWSFLAAYTQQPIILTGMGASYNALYPAWFYLKQQGQSVSHLETSALIHYMPSVLNAPGIIVAVSQSGESIEIQRLVEQIKTHRLQGKKSPILISITNAAQNSLADHSDIALPTLAGLEVGVATKTYTSSMLLLHFVAKALAGQLQARDFEQGDAIASSIQTHLLESGMVLDHAFDTLKSCTYIAIVGRGPSLATAKNGALILKEGVRVPAEGYSGGQFRHGPREMVTPNIGIIILTSPDQTLTLNQRLATDILEYGGQLVCIGQPTPSGGVNIPLPALEDVYLHPILEILPIQLLAAQLAAHKNIIPGEFRWSGKVVHEE